MELPSESRRRFRQHAERLDALVRELEHASHWRTRRHIAEHAPHYIQKLLAHLLRPDGVTGGEVALLSEYHRDGMTVWEEHEWIRETVASSPNFLSEIPEFLHVAHVHDQRLGTRLVPAMLSEIAELGGIAVAADLHVGSGESDFSPHLALLKSAFSVDE